MKLKEIYSNKNKAPVISYEVFPPKDDSDGMKLENLFSELDKLNVFHPSLISVTYGAGGSNQNQSLEIIERIKNDLKTVPMPHFTCVSTDEHNILFYLKSIKDIGVQNILALRGDVPEDGFVCKDFKHASDLVKYIKAKTDLSVAVAGYPEMHKDAVSFEKDLDYLKKKVDLGADVVYTQLFFKNEHFFNFINACDKNGLNAVIVPGILPVTNYKQLSKMAQLCKVEIPEKMAEVLDKHKDDRDYIRKYGIEFSIEQCNDLLKNGVEGIHFYTLNKSYAVSKILSEII